MSELVTASLQPKIDEPLEDTPAGQFYHNLIANEEVTDYLVYFYNSLALETFHSVMSDAVPEAKAFVGDGSYGSTGFSWDQYNTRFTDNHTMLANLIGVTLGKSGGLLHLPLFRFAPGDIISTWRGAWPNVTLFDREFSGQQQVIGIALSRLLGDKSSLIKRVKPNLDIVDKLFDKELGFAADALDEYIEQDSLNLATNFLKGFEFRITVEPKTRWNLESGKDEEVELTDPVDRILHMSSNYVVMAYAVLDLPMDMAKYVTQSETPDPRLVYQWFKTHYSSFIMEAITPSPMADLPDILEDISALRLVKLTNDDDLAVGFDGDIYYIPTIDTLDTYNAFKAELDKSKIETKNGLTFDPGLLAMKAREAGEKLDIGSSQKNMILYTDWRLNQVLYLNTTGGLNQLDTNGFQPVRKNSEIAVLETYVSKDNATSALADIPRILKVYGKSLVDFMEVDDFQLLLPIAMRQGFKNAKTVDDAVRVVKDSRISYNWPYSVKELTPYKLLTEVRVFLQRGARMDEELYGTDFDYSTVSDGSTPTMGDLLTWPGVQSIKRAIEFIHEQTKGNYNTLCGLLGVQRLMSVAPFYSVIARTTSLVDLVAADQLERVQYLKPPLDENYTPAPVPNITDEVSLLPHQVRVDNAMEKDPDNAVLAVQAGGGKTFHGIIDGLRASAKGERVGIVCPNYLMKNYIEDANYMAKGKVNIICIDNQIFNRYGEEALEEMIRNAPPNTLVVIGLSVFSKGKNIDFSYAGQNIVINQVVEFLRNLEFDRIIIDESHYLANETSNRSATMARFLGGVKKRREMTGTYINSTVQDALGQSRLMDPSTLGTTEDFVEEHSGGNSRGGKIIVPIPGAQAVIFRRLKDMMAFIDVRRKEWVALLPDRVENFHFVDLSKAQQAVYQSILEEVIKEIEADENIAGKLKSGDNEEDSENLEQYLKRYLARIERYLACCELDELGQRMLEGDDLVSPKSRAVEQILDRHFADPEYAGGKVLIFTSYRPSAQSIYDNLPARWKKYALHYEAENKDQLIPLMKKDPNVKIVVGVEASLNTGHNFQMFNRLIRIETVWNPGTLDQAESRLNRPDVKNKYDKRSKIAYDWVCVNRTIDVTKTARLISKLISAAKFGSDVNRYSVLPDLPSVSMNFDAIKALNDWESTLGSYLEAFKLYRQIEQQEFHEYREATKNKEPMALPSAGVMKGSALIDVPYVPNMTLPYQEELGLVNLGDYALDMKMSVNNLDTKKLSGKRVHTEFGDGTILTATKSSIRIEFDDGDKFSVDKLSAFLIPPKLKGPVKIAIQQMVGLKTKKTTDAKKVVEEQVEVDVKKQEVKEKKESRPKKPVPNLDLEENAEIELFITACNSSLALQVDAEDPDATPALMKKLGFKLVEPYVYAHIRTYRHLDTLLAEIEDNFSVPASQIALLESIQEAFTSGKSKLLNVEQLQLSELRNFYMMQKKTPKKGSLFIYPIIEGGELYVCAWQDQPSAKKLARIAIPGVRWKVAGSTWMRFFERKAAAKDFILDMGRSGITISNLDEVKEEYKAIRLIK